MGLRPINGDEINSSKYALACGHREAADTSQIRYRDVGVQAVEAGSALEESKPPGVWSGTRFGSMSVRHVPRWEAVARDGA
jgi:hypothetical protein